MPGGQVAGILPEIMGKQSTVPTVGRRGRPPGRSLQQEEQRKRNRAEIIAAAAKVFAAKPYAQATIDDILAGANISRATFYAHFESKLALGIEIYDSITDSWFALFGELANMPTLTITGLKRWTLALADLYVEHGYVTPLVEQLAVVEASFRQRLAQDRDMMINRLADAGVPGCRAAIGDGRQALLQRARLQLLLQRLDQVCGILAHSDASSPELADAYIEAMAEELLEKLGGQAG